MKGVKYPKSKSGDTLNLNFAVGADCGRDVGAAVRVERKSLLDKKLLVL